jgi:tetratricopeptide (TPR) repeat protein
MASAIRNLSERRVPQVLAIYLGAAFGVVQFVDFVGSRYLLPAVWTDLTLLAMALLLPSVLLYTYHHGRPGKDEWQRSEKVFIPINLLVLIALVTMVGAGAPLGPTSTRITVKDEDGNTREAVVPNEAYRKRVAMFMFDGADGDAAWLKFGVPWMTFQDLQQQNFIEVVPSAGMREGLRKVGFESGVDVPLSLKRDVVQELHVPHFITGKIEKAGNEYIATVQLYETESLKLIKERTYRAADAAQLPDQISVGIMEDLEIARLADSKPDMPVSELLSKNAAALREYIEGAEAYMNRNDYARAGALFDQATQKDPTFAAAHLQRYATALYSNQQAVAAPALNAAMKHSYRLPERMREMLKADHYLMKGDYVRAFAVLDMLAQLYPEDIQVQQQLMQVNLARDNKDAVIKAMRTVLTLDPTRSELILQLGQTYEAKGDDRAALKEYERYAAKYPQDPRAHRRIGNLQRRVGARAAAENAYEKALLIDPQDVATLVELGHLDRYTGKFAEAEARYAQALAAATTPQTREQAIRGRASLYEFRGQVRQSIKTTEGALAEAAKYMPPAAVLLNSLQLPGQWARIDAAVAERKLDELRKSLTPPWSLNVPIAELLVYVELGDVERAEHAVNAIEQLMTKSKLQSLRSMVLYGRGRVAELRGDCRTAVANYQESAALDPSDTSIHAHLGRCLRKMKQVKDAQAELNKVLTAIPAHGASNLEMGLLMKESGDAAKARAYLQRALQTWQNADSNFKPAAQAREVLATL